MKISPYMNISRIEFMVTYYCTGRCMHCSVGDRLGKGGGHSHVRAGEAAAAIRWLAENFRVTSVMTFGGEPLLYPETVFEIHKTARDCGVGARQLITNGYFSKDAARIDGVARSLKDCGVNSLMLSVDAFHQDAIPLGPVRSFVASLKRAGIEGLRLHPAWLVNADDDNPYNRKTRAILAGFGDLDVPVSSGNDIFLAGNAAKYLAGYYPPPRLDMSERCGSMPYTEPPTRVTSLSIEPNGDVRTCAQVIGNIYSESMADIAARYDPYEDEYLRALIGGGAPALMEAAANNGRSVDASDCYSICDLCKKICG